MEFRTILATTQIYDHLIHIFQSQYVVMYLYYNFVRILLANTHVTPMHCYMESVGMNLYFVANYHLYTNLEIGNFAVSK